MKASVCNNHVLVGWLNSVRNPHTFPSSELRGLCPAIMFFSYVFQQTTVQTCTPTSRSDWPGVQKWENMQGFSFFSTQNNFSPLLCVQMNATPCIPYRKVRKCAPHWRQWSWSAAGSLLWSRTGALWILDVLWKAQCMGAIWSQKNVKCKSPSEMIQGTHAKLRWLYFT